MSRARCVSTWNPFPRTYGDAFRTCSPRRCYTYSTCVSHLYHVLGRGVNRRTWLKFWSALSASSTLTDPTRRRYREMKDFSQNETEIRCRVRDTALVYIHTWLAWFMTFWSSDLAIPHTPITSTGRPGFVYRFIYLLIY